MPNQFWIVDPAREPGGPGAAEYGIALAEEVVRLSPHMRPRTIYVNTIGVGGAYYDALRNAVDLRGGDVLCAVRPFHLAEAEPFADLLAHLLPPAATRRLVWQRKPEAAISTDRGPDVWVAPYAHTLTDDLMIEPMLEMARIARERALRCDVCGQAPAPDNARQIGDPCAYVYGARLDAADNPLTVIDPGTPCPGHISTLAEIVRRGHEARTFAQTPPLNLPASYEPPFGFRVVLTCDHCTRQMTGNVRHGDPCWQGAPGWPAACRGVLRRTVVRDPEQRPTDEAALCSEVLPPPEVARETSPPPADVPATHAHGPVQPREETEAGTALPDAEAQPPALTLYEAQVFAAHSSGLDRERRMLYCTNMPGHPDHQAHTGFKTEGERCDAALNLCPLIQCPGKMFPRVECDTCRHVYPPGVRIDEIDQPCAYRPIGTGPTINACTGTLRVYLPRGSNLKPKT